MTSKATAGRKMVDAAYKSDTLNFAVYGQHCFRAVPGNVGNDVAVAKIRLSRGGWTPVASIGEARLAYVKFNEMCDMEGLRPRDQPGGMGLVANDKGELVYLIYPAGVAEVTYLGRCGGVVTDTPETIDLCSVKADEADEGVAYCAGASDEWAVGYQGEFRGKAPAGDTNFG